MVYRRYKKKAAPKRSLRKRSYRRKRIVKPFKSVVGVNRNAQIFNKQRMATHFYKDTVNWQDIIGAGTALTGLVTFDMGMLPRYSSLTALYRQYKVHNIKCIFKLRTIELSDNEQHPQMLVRYNYDPNLTVGSLNENYLLRQNNIVSKQFIHNTPEGTTLEYTIKPCVMHALKQWNTAGFVPSPRFNQWCDFTTASTSEIGLFGLCYWINNLPTGQIIDFDIQFTYSCRDII